MKNNISRFADLINFQSFHFKECNQLITNAFITSLQKNDVFSCHCLDFMKYLNFKRCDKKFREAFFKFLSENNIKYVISNQPLTQSLLDNFFNAEKIVSEGMDKKISPKFTQREFYHWVAKESDKTFDEVVQNSVKLKRNISGTLEIKEEKQKLNGSFNGGCWLTLWKEK